MCFRNCQEPRLSSLALASAPTSCSAEGPVPRPHIYIPARSVFLRPSSGLPPSGSSFPSLYVLANS